MKLTPLMTIAALGLAGAAFAQDSNTLSIDGEAMITETAAPAHMENVDTIYSGWRFRSQETQAIEMDEFDNPAMISWIKASTCSKRLKGLKASLALPATRMWKTSRV